MSKQKLGRILTFLSAYTAPPPPPTTILSCETIRPVRNTPKTRSQRGSILRPFTPSWVNAGIPGCYGSVHFKISLEGKPKFKIRETELKRREQTLIKKRLKVKRAKERRKRNDAKFQDPRNLTVKYKKPTFPRIEKRLKEKLKNAKMKEASLIERLKGYEVQPVQGPIVKPYEVTGEEHLYIMRMAQKTSNYVPVGRRGIFGGVILNMHLHWKRYETVKVICKHCKPDQLEEYKNVIARLSGGFPVQTIGTDTIIFYRGRDYEQPKVVWPIDTLSKAQALRKSKYEQALEATRHVIEIVEKELELYHRHMALYDDPNNDNSHTILGHSTGSTDLKMPKALYDDPNNDNSHTILGHSTGSTDLKMPKDSTVANVSSQVRCKGEAADLPCQEGAEVGNIDGNAVHL